MNLRMQATVLIAGCLVWLACFVRAMAWVPRGAEFSPICSALSASIPFPLMILGMIFCVRERRLRAAHPAVYYLGAVISLTPSLVIVAMFWYFR